MSLDAPNSDVDICNLAGTMVKAEPDAVNLDPPKSKFEKLCAVWYQQERQATLRAHPWNFAITRRVITPDATAPTFGFTSAFNLPQDFIRYLSRHDELGQRPIPEDISELYQIENNQILLNVAAGQDLNLRYIFDQTDISRWDPLAIQFFATNLAIRLAPNFSSRSESVIARLERQRINIKTEAQAIDGQERPPIRVQRSKWIQARRMGTSRFAGPFTKFD